MSSFKPRRRRLPARLRGQDRQRGAFTLELLTLAPLIILMFCALLQAGLWYLARGAAETAARKGVEAGRIEGATPADGAARARAWLDGIGTVEDAQVSTAGSTEDRVRVHVTGGVVTLVPGWDLRVSQSAEGPVERWEVD